MKRKLEHLAEQPCLNPRMHQLPAASPYARSSRPEGGETSKRRSFIMLVATLATWASAGSAHPAVAAVRAPSILIYGPTLFGSPENEQTIAQSLGYTVTVADESTWSQMTTADFASYNTIVFGDPTCSQDVSILATAVANRTTWSPAVAGHIEVLGTDPVYHQGVGQTLKLISDGLSWTAHGSGTGLYVDLSCYYISSPPATPIDLLAEFGTFTAQGQSGACDDVGITVQGYKHPALRGITQGGLAHWGCSIHEFITSYPADFGVLAQDSLGHLPYIIATKPR
jgi:hypothetical protein